MPKIVPSLLILLALLAPPAGADPKDIIHLTPPQRWLDEVLPESLPDQHYPAYLNDLDKAKAQAFHGGYKLSLMTLARLHPRKPEELVAAALIKGTSLAALGRQQEAIAALSDPAVASDPHVQLQRAQALAALGLTDDALAALREHLRAHPDSMGGHYLLGMVCEQAGDVAAARDAYAWFVAAPQKYLEKWETHDKGPFDNAEDVTWMGRALDRWAALTEAYRDNANLHRTILGMFVKAYDAIDREYWPAHVAAGEYFMSHDQRKEASEELTAALEANPNDIRSLQLFGQIHLETFNFDAADQAIDAIRRVNPHATEADTLEARNLLLQRRPLDAETPVRHVLERQPKHIEGLGLLAAVNALQLNEEKTADILRQVDHLDPHNASAYFEVAQQLAAMRQYPRSADKYKLAIARAPWWTAAQNGLGLLYTQSGDEDLAYAVLNDAHKLDPFNLATTNYLRLLDMMNTFAKKESAHFVVMYDPKADPVIPEYFSEYLESVHAELCAAFQFTPAVKTYIEVFPTHAAFSVRTTGSPWIGTVGASTGRVIALVAPRPGENTMGPFNWSQVLRHEYTHTITLGETDNRIQHWMTEGLAVSQERAPMRWEWVPMLYHAVKHHELFPLDKLTWSFVRPKRPIDRQLAYAESYWICKYVEDTYGHGAILKMLEDFRNAQRQEEVFPRVTGRSMDQFQTEFLAWCDQQVAKWGYDEESNKKYTALREKAEGLMKARQYADAAKAWEEIAVLRPVDSLPHQRLAGLYLTRELRDNAKAIEHLQVLAKVELKDNRYDKRLARLYRDTGRLDDAAHTALDAVYIDPYDRSAHELLAEIDEKANNARGLEREKRVIDMLDQLKAAQDNTEKEKPPAEGN